MLRLTCPTVHLFAQLTSGAEDWRTNRGLVFGRQGLAYRARVTAHPEVNVADHPMESNFRFGDNSPGTNNIAGVRCGEAVCLTNPVLRFGSNAIRPTTEILKSSELPSAAVRGTTRAQVPQ